MQGYRRVLPIAWVTAPKEGGTHAQKLCANAVTSVEAIRIIVTEAAWK